MEVEETQSFMIDRNEAIDSAYVLAQSVQFSSAVAVPCIVRLI